MCPYGKRLLERENGNGPRGFLLSSSVAPPPPPSAGTAKRVMPLPFLLVFPLAVFKAWVNTEDDLQSLCGLHVT
jgi:hypothetical protein